MGVKVATGCCLNWSQPSISHSPSSSKRRSLTDFSLVCRYVHPSSSSSSFGAKLNRSRSCETFISSKPQKSSIKRIVSATFDSHYSGEEFKFSPDIHDFTVRFQLSDDDVTDSDDDVTKKPDSGQLSGGVSKWFGDMIPASIERKANSVDLPFSLRIIQKKKQWEEGFREAGEFAYCSMKKAFSSMVFIIRELQSYTLQMREVLFVEDLQEILMRVQTNSEFDSSTVKTYSVTPGGKTTSIGGINGGGGKFRPATSGTDGDGRFDQQNEHQTIVPDGPSSSTLNPTSTSEELVSGEAEELVLWKSIEAEAEKMREVSKVAGLDSETMRRFVSPVNVKMEEEVDTGVYLKTELVYQMGLLEEPDNPLLLANYAQFLYLFYHDHTRAEEYFKKATKIEPKDAEAFNKYASFLWHAKNDLWAAEESFLEAISADPNNPFYTATYSHFLWSNGADDTCFPLGSPENVNSDEA
ncbi:putative tetratricopeptide-like helical domain superfamily [Helianthus annuus]|nr:putative tetratricopeptide-like helical domain superfamily [Helianthus annuus]